LKDCFGGPGNPDNVEGGGFQGKDGGTGGGFQIEPRYFRGNGVVSVSAGRGRRLQTREKPGKKGGPPSALVRREGGCVWAIRPKKKKKGIEKRKKGKSGFVRLNLSSVACQNWGRRANASKPQKGRGGDLDLHVKEGKKKKNLRWQGRGRT